MWNLVLLKPMFHQQLSAPWGGWHQALAWAGDNRPMARMQLQDILFSQGFGTRRVCAGLVQQGFVAVAGSVCEDAGEWVPATRCRCWDRCWAFASTHSRPVCATSNKLWRGKARARLALGKPDPRPRTRRLRPRKRCQPPPQSPAAPNRRRPGGCQNPEKTKCPEVACVPWPYCRRPCKRARRAPIWQVLGFKGRHQQAIFHIKKNEPLKKI